MDHFSISVYHIQGRAKMHNPQKQIHGALVAEPRFDSSTVEFDSGRQFSTVRQCFDSSHCQILSTTVNHCRPLSTVTARNRTVNHCRPLRNAQPHCRPVSKFRLGNVLLMSSGLGPKVVVRLSVPQLMPLIILGPCYPSVGRSQA